MWTLIFKSPKIRTATLLILLFSSSLNLSAQNPRYENVMKTLLSKMDTIKTSEGFNSVSNEFMRIALVEKKEWLPYYYAAFAKALASMSDVGNADQMVPEAITMLDKATELGGDESEICCVFNMVYTAKMLVNPAVRWQTDGETARGFIEKSIKANPRNPRPYYLIGQSLLYTPENFGGGKKAAMPYFEKSQKCFDEFVPASPLHPDWGKSRLSEILKKLLEPAG